MRNGYPLIELHRHLDGNVRIETVIDLGRKHNIALPAWEVESLRPHVQVVDPKPDLMSFIAKFEWPCQAMVDYEAIKRITDENLEDAVRENIDYIELRFSPYFMAQAHNLDTFGVTEAVCQALAESKWDVKAKLIVIMSRTFGPDKCREELEAAIRFREYGVVALDLAGDEANFPGKLFVDHFRKARDAGLHVIAHAGEAAGAESVKQAILGLGAERIGHGVRSIEDPAVMKLLGEKTIGLECCPTSNIQTSTVSSYREHPITQFLQKDLLATLNTDDPGISGIDLAYEYQVAQKEIGLSEKELRSLQENSLRVAFLTDEERKSLEAK